MSNRNCVGPARNGPARYSLSIYLIYGPSATKIRLRQSKSHQAKCQSKQKHIARIPHSISFALKNVTEGLYPKIPYILGKNQTWIFPRHTAHSQETRLGEVTPTIWQVICQTPDYLPGRLTIPLHGVQYGMCMSNCRVRPRSNLRRFPSTSSRSSRSGWTLYPWRDWQPRELSQDIETTS